MRRHVSCMKRKRSHGAQTVGLVMQRLNWSLRSCRCGLRLGIVRRRSRAHSPTVKIIDILYSLSRVIILIAISRTTRAHIQAAACSSWAVMLPV